MGRAAIHSVPNGRHRAGGFTLLEILVVVSIFGVFALMAYGGLSTVLNARRHIEQSLARTAEYQMAYSRLRDDFLNGSGRTTRDSNGTSQPAFIYDGTSKRLEFTRGGWANPVLLPRSTLERVSYFVDDTHSDNYRLIRRNWLVLDRAQDSQPVDLSLLEHIDKVQWRFLDNNMQWQDHWPADTSLLSTLGNGGQNNSAAAAAIVPPLAADLTVDTRDGGQLRLLFRFGAEGLSLVNGSGSSSGGSSSGGTLPP
jgi:general secretion pathway protein J